MNLEHAITGALFTEIAAKFADDVVRLAKREGLDPIHALKAVLVALELSIEDDEELYRRLGGDNE